MYGKRFFRNRSLVAYQSAEILCPLILRTALARGLEVEATFTSGSVAENVRGRATMIDLGCGDGVWAEVYRRHGLSTFGIDGPWSPYPDAIKVDLSKANLARLDALVPARVDFIQCLEFLEHVDEQRGTDLVTWMTDRTDVIVLSAAVPYQGGSGHVNEQWPSYWVQKLGRLGFVACDALRPAIWNDVRIAPWYRQNILVFFRDAVPPDIEATAMEEWRQASRLPLDLVHPDLLLRKSFWKLASRFGF